jgi:hypothetical protein
LKIFISHSHADRQAAKALVDYLLSVLPVDDATIRATSVPGHMLPFGRTIAETLKDDITLAPIIIALITKNSASSSWVLFELGASWALGKTIYPVFGPAVTASHLPGPIPNLPRIDIDNPDASARLSDLVAQIAKSLSLHEKTGGKAQTNLETFRAALCASPEPATDQSTLQDRTLRAIWKLDEDENSYYQHGYTVQEISREISRTAQVKIPKCQHALEFLLQAGYVIKRQVSGGKNAECYSLKKEGSDYLIKNSLVE